MPRTRRLGEALLLSPPGVSNGPPSKGNGGNKGGNGKGRGTTNQGGNGGIDPSWSQLQLPGLQAWYDASQQSGANHSTLANFLDRSGNGFNGTITGIPSLEYAAIGSAKAFQFYDAIGNVKQHIALGTSLMDGATAGFYYAVIQCAFDPSTDPWNGPILGNFGSGARFPQTDGLIYEGFGTNATKSVNPTPNLTAAHLYEVETQANSYIMRLDGVVIFSTNTNTVSFGSATQKYVAGSEDLGNHFRGFIGEIGICNQIPTSDHLANLRAKMATKYGLSL